MYLPIDIFHRRLTKIGCRLPMIISEERLPMLLDRLYV